MTPYGLLLTFDCTHYKMMYNQEPEVTLLYICTEIEWWSTVA